MRDTTAASCLQQERKRNCSCFDDTVANSPSPGMDGQVQLMNQQVFAWWSPLTLFGFDSRSTSLGCWLVLVTLLVSASAVRPAQLQWHGRNLVTAVRNQVSKAPGQSQSFF
jgi:hypothetical protein